MADLLTAPGELATPETIKCPLLDLHTLGNASKPAAYNYSMDISNNQSHYVTLHTESPLLVWHSDWIWWECLQEGQIFPKVCTQPTTTKLPLSNAHSQCIL